MSSTQTYTITPAVFPTDKEAIISLFSDYTSALGLDLTFQDYSTELNSLPGKYSPENGGIILIARDVSNQGMIVGCVAVRALPISTTISTTSSTSPVSDGDDKTMNEDKGYCEMKRLYISPSARGSGLGARLVEAIIQHARGTGLYKGIRLDTLSGEYMASARVLYGKYGFREIEKYYETPVEGTIFMGLDF
ncbi:acyl-CoA N-acyltransferase [Talaromyces proteolyticus]|uniref:Acyl-CoA N-acyltransferase n=1 Tax=Talaromyces proteolyticus TaxID=1131652 RepID=A0AAD4KZH7_9EURO|nr:acyl-CoA N-acyltransferase [Talaromyces proteolyticus]KAH8700961.1 acyl-CoA N-acyltransferase [Talaromyces proteolyticus]